jgi:hypothetical protein
MKFSTPVSILKLQPPIDYNSKILLLGSCFAENISSKFQYYKFQTLRNPFGIIFNAVSLEKVIHRIITKKYFTEADVFFHNDLWHCFEVHSELSHPDQHLFLNHLNQLISSTHQEIHSLTHCFITLGTSWVYRHNKTGEIVANCHKLPQYLFTKELLTVAQIQKSVQNSIDLIKSINSNIAFVFTISPVRHIKDGFFENNVSKAHLFSALYEILQLQGTYFPSYEMVIDELRDYRFYAKDLLHPADVTLDYIWQRLSETYFDEETIQTMQEIVSIQKRLAHKPFNPHTENHQKFLEEVQQKIAILTSKLPNITF